MRESNDRDLSASFWSVGKKLIAVISISVILGFALLMGLQTYKERTNLYAMAQADYLTITRLIGDQISGGVRWKKAEAVERGYAHLAKDDSSNLADLLVKNIDVR